MAGDAAAASGLSYDRWQDLELAVDELAALLLGGQPIAIDCVLRPSDRGVSVEMSAVDASRPVPSDELSELVLGGTTSALTLSLDADPPSGGFSIPVN
jgi:hypothetical protein